MLTADASDDDDKPLPKRKVQTLKLQEAMDDSDDEPFPWRKIQTVQQPLKLQKAMDDSDDEPLPRRKIQTVQPPLKLQKAMDDSDDEPLPMHKVQTMQSLLKLEHAHSQANKLKDDRDIDLDDLPAMGFGFGSAKMRANKIMDNRPIDLDDLPSFGISIKPAISPEEKQEHETKMREQFADTPNIIEEYKFLVDNFYKGDSHASFDHIKNMLQFMANVRLNPENMRSKTANKKPGEARVGVPKYFSAVHFLESYVYLNMHKYPLFYAYLHGGPCRQETLIVKRLSERFRGNRASMAKSITSFDSYAGLVNYTHKGQTLHALANVVIHMLLTCLLLIKDKFEIVFYPEITRESVRRFLIDETFPKIQRFDKATDKRIELCVEIAAFAEEAFFDHDAATLEALEKLINNVMSIGEATLRRRIHVVVNRSVIDPA